MSSAKKTLEEVADFCLGKMLDKKKNKGDLRPYLANVNVRWGEFEFDKLREMRFEQHELVKFGLKSGDIVMCEGGEPGRCAIWKNQIPGMMIQKALHRIRPHECLDNHFLYYTFLDYGQNGQFAPLFTGATIKHLPREKLALLEVKIPPLPTQRKIASILSAYDDLIENNTRRIAILEEMAQAIYREWFVNFRYPGHENVKLVDSKIGKIPEGWEVKTVGDFGNVITGKTPSKKKEEYYDGEICFVKTPDMHGNLFCLTTTETLSELGRDSQLRQTVPKNSICISCIGTVGVISITTAECQTNQQINTIVPSSTHWREFIVLALKDNVPRLKQMGAAGATMDNISKGKLVGFQILHPPHDVVSEFSLLVHDMFERIKLSQRQNNVLRNTRDLLLPKLISGKLDVEDLDIDVMDPIQTTEEASS